MTWLAIVWVTLVLVGLANCILFITAYHFKTRGAWRYYPMGRHLMGFIAALAVPFALMAWSMLVGPLGPLPWIIALTCINLVLVQRNWLLLTRHWRSLSGEQSTEIKTTQGKETP